MLAFSLFFSPPVYHVCFDQQDSTPVSCTPASLPTQRNLTTMCNTSKTLAHPVTESSGRGHSVYSGVPLIVKFLSAFHLHPVNCETAANNYCPRHVDTLKPFNLPLARESNSRYTNTTYVCVQPMLALDTHHCHVCG